MALPTLPGLDPAHAARLITRQASLHAEAAQVLSELRLRDLLGQAGQVVQNGSSVAGLMVWRDIDFSVISPGLARAAAFELLQPLFIHPDVTGVRYMNQAERFTFEGLPENARYYLTVYYQPQPEHDWKLDISFWLDPSRDEAAYTRRLTERLTDETRLAILWLKDIWHRSPRYHVDVHSTTIYEAVLDGGVRTPAEFEDWIAGGGLSDER